MHSSSISFFFLLPPFCSPSYQSYFHIVQIPDQGIVCKIWSAVRNKISLKYQFPTCKSLDKSILISFHLSPRLCCILSCLPILCLSKFLVQSYSVYMLPQLNVKHVKCSLPSSNSFSTSFINVSVITQQMLHQMSTGDQIVLLSKSVT